MAVVLWAVLILALGGQDFSAEATGGWLEGLLRTFFPDVDPGRLEPIHFVSRKAAHLIEYAVLGLLSYHALALDGPSAVARPALLALLLVAGVAAVDEGRQALLESRTGSARDMGIDVLGGAIGLSALILVARLTRRRRNAEAVRA
jgi:VanZ family protein